MATGQWAHRCRRPGSLFVDKTPEGQSPSGELLEIFWTQESIRRKISDETCLKTFGPADPSDFREISPDPSCGLIAASLSLHSWRTPV